MIRPAEPSHPIRSVLIVDDLEDNRTLLERVLRSGGYAVTHASSGREALAFIAQQTFDIVLLDWMMPELSGLETLRAIREQHSKAHLPVIMCTAIDEEASVVSALAAGANDYMMKPISVPILRARMATHLEQRETLNQAESERLLAERRLGEQTRAMFVEMARDRQARSA